MASRLAAAPRPHVCGQSCRCRNYGSIDWKHIGADGEHWCRYGPVKIAQKLNISVSKVQKALNKASKLNIIISKGRFSDSKLYRHDYRAENFMLPAPWEGQEQASQFSTSVLNCDAQFSTSVLASLAPACDLSCFLS
jgi:hypothetical protein